MAGGSTSEEYDPVSKWAGKDGAQVAEFFPKTADDVEAEAASFYADPWSPRAELDKALRAAESVEVDKYPWPGRADLRVLDVGCSRGGKLHMLEEAGVKPECLFGVDVSPEAVAECAEAHPRYNVKLVSEEWDVPVEWTRGGSDPQEAWPFDLVMISAVLIHVPHTQQRRFLSRLSRLAPRVLLAEMTTGRGAHRREANGHGFIFFTRDMESLAQSVLARSGGKEVYSTCVKTKRHETEAETGTGDEGGEEGAPDLGDSEYNALWVGAYSRD